VPDNNWHFGWPVATRTTDAIVVVFQRTQHHHGSPRPGLPSRSTAVAVRSTDGGQTWSAPVDLRTFIDKPAEITPGAMRAITTTSRGTIVYIGDLGAFRSEDSGQTWLHYPDAFAPFDAADVLNHNIGPRIVETADGRLLAFSHLWMNDLSLPNRLWMWVSKDDGKSWTQEILPLPTGFHAVEPSVCLLNDTLFILGRFHDKEKGFDKKNQTYLMMQVAIPLEDPEFAVAAVTNIRTNHAVDIIAPIAGEGKAQSLGGFWSQDTPDITFNPITRRLEAVVTNRTGGGGPFGRDFTRQSLNLWSISPEDFLAGNGEWKFEGILFERATMDVTKTFDGMHPAGAVLDEAGGRQHVFFYAGYYHGPSGVFRLTRPLETTKITHQPEPDKNPQPIKTTDMKTLRKYYATLGLAAALAGPVQAELIEDGLILQLDATTISGINAQNATWVNAAGTTRPLIVPEGSELSPVVENALGGQPVVDFDASLPNRWQLPPRFAEEFAIWDGNWTAITVFRAARTSSWHSILRKGNYLAATQEGFNVAAIAGGPNGRVVTRIANQNEESAGVQSSIAKPNEFVIYNAVLRNGTLEGFLNGKAGSPFGPSTTLSGVVNPRDSLFIGIDFSGQIAEILVYNRALSLDEIEKVNAYLNQKYGLEVPPLSKVE